MAYPDAFILAPALLADRPSAGRAGYLFYATDARVLYRDNGTTWDAVANLVDLALYLTVASAEADFAAIDHTHEDYEFAVRVNGSVVGTRPTLNLIAGDNVSIGGADNSGQDRVDVTVNATGGGGGGDTVYAPAGSSLHAAGDLSGVLTFPASTDTRINWGAGTSFPGGLITTGSLWRFTVPVGGAGLYIAGVTLALEPIALTADTQTFSLLSLHNDTEAILESDEGPTAAGTLVTLAGTRLFNLADGDTLAWVAANNTGANWQTSALGASHFFIARVPIAVGERGQVMQTFYGAAQVESSPFRIPNTLGSTLAIERVTVVTQADDGPTGAALIADVNIDGTTIFTNQANRPQVADGATTGSSSAIDVPVWPADAILTVDIDQVGSGSPGSNVVVVVTYVK